MTYTTDNSGNSILVHNFSQTLIFIYYCKMKGRTKVKMKVIQSCPTLYNPMEYTVLGILQARILEWVPFSRRRSLLQETFPSPGDLPNPGIEPRSPKLQADSLPAEPPGKPKDTGVGSLSLLQQIFPTQELKGGFPAL